MGIAREELLSSIAILQAEIQTFETRAFTSPPFLM